MPDKQQNHVYYGHRFEVVMLSSNWKQGQKGHDDWLTCAGQVLLGSSPSTEKVREGRRWEMLRYFQI